MSYELTDPWARYNSSCMEWPTEKQLVLDCEDNLYKVYENCWAACATGHTNGPGIEIGAEIDF